MRSCLFLSAVFLFLIPARAFAVDPAPGQVQKITPRFLQFDDEYHSLDLQLHGANSSLQNMNLTLTNMIENCDMTKRLRGKGVTNSNDVKACEYQVEQKRSEVDLHKLYVNELERSMNIAKLNRSSESGKPMSMSDLAAQYVSKWKDEATQAGVRTTMAKRRLVMEEAVWEHQKRMMKKGYLSWDEYESSRVRYAQVRNDVDTAVEREDKIKTLLAKSEQNLAEIKKAEAPEVGPSLAPPAATAPTNPAPLDPSAIAANPVVPPADALATPSVPPDPAPEAAPVDPTQPAVVDQPAPPPSSTPEIPSPRPSAAFASSMRKSSLVIR